MYWKTAVKPDVTWHTCRFTAGPVEFELTVRDAEQCSWSVSIILRPNKYVLTRGNREIGEWEAKRAAGAWLKHFLIQAAASAALTENSGDPMIAPPSAWKTDSDRPSDQNYGGPPTRF